MKIKLLRDTRPFGRTGDIVEVSPSGLDWLLSLGMAVPADEIGEHIETPEKAMVIETAAAVKAVPMKAPKTAKATAKKKGK